MRIVTKAFLRYLLRRRSLSLLQLLGIACGIDAETYVAAMAEVKVDKTSGKINLSRVGCAQDMGHVVNPQGATIQIEGCITMGLGYALAEEIHFKNGQRFDTKFDT